MIFPERPEEHVLQHSDLFDIRTHLFEGQYFDIDEDGVRFRDVVTQEPLHRDEVPPSLLRDPMFAAGFDYLRARGKRGDLTVRLLLAPHGQARDFTDTLRHYSHAMEEVPFMGIEAEWAPHDQAATPSLDQAELRLLPRTTGRGAFQYAQTSWLVQHGTAPLPCSLPYDSSSVPAQTVIRLWEEVYEKAQDDPALPPAIRTATRALANLICQATRQWATLGQLGYWLHHLDATHQLPPGHLAIPLMLGSWHAPSTHRLRLLDVPVESYQTPSHSTPVHRALGNSFMHALHTQHADIGFLRTPEPF